MKTKPYYLFVCIENACRSQMAQGFFNKLTYNAIGESAGTEPAKTINPMAIEVMKEKGIDISQQGTKLLTPELIEKANKIITMGCLDSCPMAPKDKTTDWDIPDPKGKDKKSFIQVRDLIEKKIIKLLKEEGLT